MKEKRVPQGIDDSENVALRLALAQLAGNPSPANREKVYACLSSGVLILGVRELPFPGRTGVIEVEKDTNITILTTTAPDGSRTFLAFTDADALASRNPSAKPLVVPSGDVLRRVIDEGYSGLMLNPAGPWAMLSRQEVTQLIGRLASKATQPDRK